jgi:hypothetical protein
MTLGSLRRRIEGSLGQALVESALILPVVLFIIFGIIEGGLIVAGLQSANFWSNRGAQDLAQTGVDPVKGDEAALTAVRQSLLASTQLFVVDAIEVRPVTPDGQPVSTAGPPNFGSTPVDRFDLGGNQLPRGLNEVPWVARNASPANADYGGVIVHYHYRYRAGILGRQLDLTSIGVARLVTQSSIPPLLDPVPPSRVPTNAFANLRHADCQGHNASATLVGFVYVVPGSDARGGFFIHINLRKSQFAASDPTTDRLRNQHYQVYLYPADKGIPPTGCGRGDPNPVLAGTSADAVLDTDADGNGDAQLLIPQAQVAQYSWLKAPGTFTVELGSPSTKRLRFDALDDEITSDVVQAP